ncbi:MULTISPECIES: DUF4157 domain-containing protein [Acidobacteriaceae]|uniref:eCIS core domain-containing protein n=1 Tax=Acidobacteriaceae TaxID=204434 RepID=UPI00131B80D2|nr:MULTISPECIES: DUF4157 domain-containing protein [Acidobacteriaceae]MDW5265460.1 DUF4157 domain-containing protein [Edaphobacter sp.]
MSAASLVMLSREAEASSKKTSKSLRVNQPGDAYEREADRVADTVSAGGRIPGWSLASTGADQIQRDTNTTSALPPVQPIQMIGDPQDPPQANNYGDMLGKIAEAFLKTPAGKAILQHLTDDPLVQGVKDFVQTPQGVVVAGSTAIAAISGLAAAHKGLPVQLPQIPLDKFVPGLKMKIDVEGPLNHPTQGSLMFSYEGAPPKKKKGALTDKDRYRAETARIAEDQKDFRAGLAPHSQGPVASPQAQQQQADEQLARKAELRRLGNILQPGATHKPGEFTPLVPGAQPLSLGMRDADRIPATDATKNEKKEEIPVQRKAESACYDEQEAAPEVESVISSSGRPLDRETRRYMESHIGFDFSKVRIHTDSRAAASAKSLGARAYTVGNNVVFGAGRFGPSTTDGRRLLAHELTHVVQQGASPGKLNTRSVLPAVVTSAPRQIQRDPEEDSKGISFSDLGDFRKVLRKLSDKIPGYKLFTVIIGKDPLTGEAVTRNATNLIGEFLKLVGAEQTFKDLEQSGALKQAFDWLQSEVGKLNLSVEKLEELIAQAKKAAWDNKFNGVSAALRSAYEVFKPTLESVKTFAGNILHKVVEFAVDGALKLLDSTGVLKTIIGLGDAISGIVKDPKGFATNLIKALQQGFSQFGKDIVTNLKEALISWLFGELGNITPPKDITFGSIFTLMLQVLKLDYQANLRPKLVKELGEEVVSGVEHAVGIINTIRTKGLGAAWEEVKHLASDLLNSFLTEAQNWAITKVVQMAAFKIIQLVAPGGAILEALRAIYTTVEVIIQQAKKIQVLIDGIAKSISKIVAGQIGDAANYIENVLNGAIPVMISFLATYLGLGDVGEAIRQLLKKLTDKIGAGVDKIIKFIADKARALLAKGKEAVGKVLDWWKQRKEVTEGTEKHSIYLDGTEDQTRLLVASFPALTWSKFLADKADAVKSPTPEQKTAAEQIKVKAPELEKRLPPSKDDKEKAANVEAKRKLFDEVAALIVVLGLHREAAEPASLITFKPLGKDDGGTGAIASPLTSNFKAGTPPSDKPAIWTKLGSLLKKKNYKRGHLINENLGGPGIRSNLTPINTKANADHLAKIESKVKTAVLDEHKVMTYTVDAIYDTRGESEKPKQMIELEKLRSQRKLTTDEATELAEFQAEQNLCTHFNYEAFELENKGAGWVPKKNSELKFKGKVENKIEL